jgi:LEA14-like dessication related protein
MEMTTPLRLGTQLSEKIAILNVSNPDDFSILFKQMKITVEVFTIHVQNTFFLEKNVLVQDLSINPQGHL